MAQDLVMLGAGGHARVLLSTMRLLGLRIVGCVANEAPAPGWPDGIEWLGKDGLERLDPGRTALIQGVGSAGSTAVREKVFDDAKTVGFAFLSIVHPSAIVSDDAQLGEGCQVMAGAVVQPGSTLGRNVLVNSRAVIDHDGEIGDHCHIATGAVLAGAVQLGLGVHIGAGAALKQGVRIGNRAVVGVGAAVIGDVAADAVVVGVPARALQRV